MKRIIAVFLLVGILFLNGCFGPEIMYYPNDLYDVERIELVKYKNDDYKNIKPSKVELKFDSSKIERIETLDSDKIDDFLSEFEEIIFHRKDKSVNEPTGYCLIWYLKNGDFIVFSCTTRDNKGYSMVAKFDSSDKFIEHQAYFASKPHYDMVLSKYFSTYNSAY